ncbi:putative No apical meristem-associated domain-containing protein [Helianthus annuus]|nr:putative No apical meristem-associated domain-containing protein [Helianthus annuus]
MENLKKENKWKSIPNEVVTAKWSKTSESGSYSAGGSTAHCHIDINDEPEFDEEEFAVHKSERPIGRDKAKKAAAGKRKASMAGGSNQTSSEAGSKMDELISEFRSFKELTAEKYIYKKNLSADHARTEDFRIMRLDLDLVSEDER